MSCGKYNCKPLPGRKECQTCRLRKWRSKNPFLASYHHIKDRAKQRGIKFLLTKEQFKKFCDETGYLDKKGTTAESMTIDRIKNNLGYQEGNIRILSLSENVKRKKRGEGGWTAGGAERGPNDPF
jgi:hypothetical protein